MEGNLPTRPGVYLALGVWSDWDEWEEVDVYEHDIKGLCCYSEDIGSGGSEVCGETDCHVSVQLTGLKFGEFVRELDF